jgi:hypothetical protein
VSDCELGRKNTPHRSPSLDATARTTWLCDRRDTHRGELFHAFCPPSKWLDSTQRGSPRAPLERARPVEDRALEWDAVVSVDELDATVADGWVTARW